MHLLTALMITWMSLWVTDGLSDLYLDVSLSWFPCECLFADVSTKWDSRYVESVVNLISESHEDILKHFINRWISSLAAEPHHRYLHIQKWVVKRFLWGTQSWALADEKSLCVMETKSINEDTAILFHFVFSFVLVFLYSFESLI